MTANMYMLRYYISVYGFISYVHVLQLCMAVPIDQFYELLYRLTNTV